MVQEISKPAQTTYWVAKNSSGDVIHVGVVEPNQVVTTPLDVLVGFTTKIGQITILIQRAMQKNIFHVFTPSSATYLNLRLKEPAHLKPPH